MSAKKAELSAAETEKLIEKMSTEHPFDAQFLAFLGAYLGASEQATAGWWATGEQCYRVGDILLAELRCRQ